MWNEFLEIKRESRERFILASLVILIGLIGVIGIFVVLAYLGIPAAFGNEYRWHLGAQLGMNMAAFVFLMAVLAHGIVRGMGSYHKALIIIIIVIELFTVYDGAKKGWLPGPLFIINREENLLETTFKGDDKAYVQAIKRYEGKGLLYEGPFRVYDNVFAGWKGVFHAYTERLQMAFAYTEGSMGITSLNEYRKAIAKNDYTSPLWDIYNVKFLYVKDAPSDASLRKLRRVPGIPGFYVNPRSFPRAFVMTDYRVFPGKEDLLRAMRSRANYPEMREAVYLLKAPSAVKIKEPGKRGLSSVRIDGYENLRIDIAADMKTDGFLVLSEIWSPLWKAYVDGREVETLVAFNALRALELKEGVHRVEFVYDKSNRLIVAGKVLSVMTLLCVGGVLVYRRRIRRRAAGE